MKDLFVTYKEALKLKKLGFNEPCIARYTKVDKNGIFCLAISEAYFDFTINRQLYGRMINYNVKMFEREGTISAPLIQQADKFRQNTQKISKSDNEFDKFVKDSNDPRVFM